MEMKFELKQVVKLIESDEAGTVVARAEYLDGGNQYMIRYRDATGRQSQIWWEESALLAA